VVLQDGGTAGEILWSYL